jgi:hypothetical protein
MIFLPMMLCAVSVAPLGMGAQDDGVNGPPKVLVVHREFTKPGKEGAEHERTEGAFIAAMKANKGNIHYFAMSSLTGQNRALFFSGYSSFAAWEQDEVDLEKNPALLAAMDRTNAVDGDLLSMREESVWLRRDDMSRNSGNLKGARYLQISQYLVKPGHVADWERLVKMVTEGYAKGVPEASWTMFEERYGANGDAYIVVTPVKTLGEVDGMLGSGKGFMDAMGEEGMKKMGELEAAAVASWQMNLFAINPKMSNPPDEWVKAEPDYWKPKVMWPVKKVAATPAQ